MHSIATSSVALLDLTNISIAIGITWLTSAEAKMYALPVWRPSSWILGFSLIPLYPHSLRGTAEHEYGSMHFKFRAWLANLQRSARLMLTLLKNFGDSWFYSHQIGIMDSDRLDRLIPFGSPAIFRKGHDSASLNSMWLQNDSEKSGLGVIFYLPVTI